jgi:hypothetical protein
MVFIDTSMAGSIALTAPVDARRRRPRESVSDQHPGW